MRHFVQAASRTSRTPILRPFRPHRSTARQTRLSSGWSQESRPRVRVRQPWISWERLGLWCFYGVASSLGIQYVLGRIVDRLELEDDEKDMTAEAEEEEDDEEGEEGDEDTVVLSLDGDDDGSFIPFQTPKQLPLQNYKQSDPEWQEFHKLSNDKNRQREARRELAEKLAKTVSALKPLKQKLGKDIKWTKSWLDFTYPDHASPEYIRKGWVLLEDGALWSKQIIPHSQYIQLQHILWPKAVFKAGKNCLQTFYGLQAIKVKNALGLELGVTEKALQAASHVVAMQLSTDADLEHAQEQLNQTKKPDLQQQMQKQNADKLGPPEHKDASQEASSGKPWNFKELKITVPAPPMSTDFAVASRMFVVTLVHDWKQSKLDPMPPGCCYLAGDVELSGSQARCKMGVLAAYDPKANTFFWVKSKPKGFWNHKQRAKGGS